jgi:hypothetical protein
MVNQIKNIAQIAMFVSGIGFTTQLLAADKNAASSEIFNGRQTCSAYGRNLRIATAMTDALEKFYASDETLDLDECINENPRAYNSEEIQEILKRIAEEASPQSEEEVGILDSRGLKHMAHARIYSDMTSKRITRLSLFLRDAKASCLAKNSEIGARNKKKISKKVDYDAASAAFEAQAALVSLAGIKNLLKQGSNDVWCSPAPIEFADAEALREKAINLFYEGCRAQKKWQDQSPRCPDIE